MEIFILIIRSDNTILSVKNQMTKGFQQSPITLTVPKIYTIKKEYKRLGSVKLLHIYFLIIICDIILGSPSNCCFHLGPCINHQKGLARAFLVLASTNSVLLYNIV